MAQVVFLRAANVGAHQRFQPSALARELAHLEVVNVGAAGTFVVRGKISRASLRAEILGKLPFEPELMICPGREILALARTDAFDGDPDGKDVKRFVSVLDKAPRAPPSLPLSQPTGKWEVQVVGVSGRCVLSLRRDLGRKIYPNPLVEKAFGVPATTRNWNTILKIRELLT